MDGAKLFMPKENEQQTLVVPASPRPEHVFMTLGELARQRILKLKESLPEQDKITLTPDRRSSTLAGMLSPKSLPCPPPPNRSLSPIYRTGSGSRPNSCPGSRATTPEICPNGDSDDEEDIKIECYVLGDVNNVTDESGNGSIAYLTKLPDDFPLMQLEYAKKYKEAILSLRLAGKGRATRRISLALVKPDGSIEIADPAKPSKIKSKTQPENSPFSGHILDNKILCHPDREYNLKDNSISGSLPLELLDRISLSGDDAFTSDEMQAYRQLTGCDDDDDNQDVIAKFLKMIRTACKDPGITRAYLYHGMVVFSKLVTYQEKRMKGQTFDVTHEKHYIQEARSLGYVISRIYEGYFQLISYNEKALTFSFENRGKTIVAKLDLTLGIVENLKSVSLPPPTCPQSLEIFVSQSAEETAQQLVDYYQDYQLCHFPMWYIPPGEEEYAPAMIISSDNGLPYAGDMDPEHISVRHDLPWEAAISFNGRNRETEEAKDSIPLFMLGMLIVDQRIRAQDKEQYESFIAALVENLGSQDNSRERARSSDIVNLELITPQEKLELAKNYLRQINTSAGKLLIKQFLYDIHKQLQDIASNDISFYIYCDRDPHYHIAYLPTLAAAFRSYQLNPSTLLTIGQSSVHDAIMIYDTCHNMIQHGGDDKNPGPEVLPGGKAIFCWLRDSTEDEDKDKNFYVTRNEKSYLTFLLYERTILKKANFDVHPSRLLDTNPNYRLWHALIKIQALYRAQHDAQYGTDLADNFRRTLQENYRFREQGEEYVKQAQSILDAIFTEVNKIVAKIIHANHEVMDIEEQFNIVIDAEYNLPWIRTLTTIIGRQLDTLRLAKKPDILTLPPQVEQEIGTHNAQGSLFAKHRPSSRTPVSVVDSHAVNSMLLQFNNDQAVLRTAQTSPEATKDWQRYSLSKL